jgi:hypothetical protein
MHWNILSTNKNLLRVINTKLELVSGDGNCEEKNISHMGKIAPVLIVLFAVFLHIIFQIRINKIILTEQ